MTLTYGSKGYPVAKLHTELNKALGEKIPVSGVFNDSTAGAISRFQAQHGLKVDGIATDTLLALLEKTLFPHGIYKVTPIKNKNGDQERIVLVSPINSFDGYGFHGTQIATDLINFGYDVRIRAMPDERTVKSKISVDIKRRFVPMTDPQDDPWEIILWPPTRQVTPGKRTVYFTMWESTRLPIGAVEILNKADVVVVPCEWNASCFTANGVTSPIRVAQLGIYTDIFKYTPMNMEGPTVFGAAGRLAGGGARKGLGDVVAAFLKAFPTDQNVRLKIKCFPDCNVQVARDPRIILTQEVLSWAQMSDWMGSLTAFVSASRGEGFGLLQLQSLSCGRPLVATKFSGVTEFFDDECGYPVNYHLIPGQGVYENCGHFAMPSIANMTDQMIRIHENRQEAKDKGIVGATRSVGFSWQDANKRLLDVLKEFKVVGDAGVAPAS